MQEFFIGCLFFPIALAVVALLSYFLIYKKPDCYKISGDFLIILLFAEIVSLVVCLAISKWFNIDLGYLGLLGVIVGILICPLLGLNNKNLRKLNRAEEYCKLLKIKKRQKFREQLKLKSEKQVRSDLLKRNIIEWILLIIILITFLLISSVIWYWLGPKGQQIDYDKEVSKSIAVLNKTLPKDVTPYLIYNSIVKEGHTIYVTFTMTNIDAKAITSEYKKKAKAEMMPQICNSCVKQLIENGYHYIYVYNAIDRKDVFRVIADKANCQSFFVEESKVDKSK